MCRNLLPSLVALCLVITAPLWLLLAWRWPISTDFIFYSAGTTSFSAQFWAGDAYPRWLTATSGGFGSPVFVFYGPAAFYLMSLFEWTAPLDPHGFGRVFIGISLALIAAGVTAYRWLARHVSSEDARRGALLYAGFPYLLLHIYGGFAVAQLWAVALFPFLLEAADGVMTRGRRAVPKLSVAYALLCFTHLPSLLTFGAIPWLYALALSPPPRRLAAALAGASALLGAGLAAIYLLPALANKPHIASGRFLDGNLVYANNFLDTYSLLGIVSVLLPLIIWHRERPKHARRLPLSPPLRFWLAILAGLLFMALPLSRPLWDALPPLQHVQFPFRFFLPMLPGAVFIAVHWWPQVKSRRLYHGLFAVGLVCAVAYSAETGFFAGRAPVAEILERRLLARPEYQTRWMAAEKLDFQRRLPESHAGMASAMFLEGKGEASITARTGRSITLRADIASPEASIALRQLYFPGWRATSPAYTVSEHRALLALRLPQGRHDVTLTLPWFEGERAGAIISLAALMIVLVTAGIARLQSPVANSR